MDVFKASAAEGFRPSDYLTPDLDLAAAGTDPLKLAAVETAFSALGRCATPSTSTAAASRRPTVSSPLDGHAQDASTAPRC